MNVFKDYFVGHNWGSDGRRNSEDDQHQRVQLSAFAKLVEGKRGLYDAYQSVTDPGTVVLCAGAVDDSLPDEIPGQWIDTRSGRVDPSSPLAVNGATFSPRHAPRIVRSLLGMKIAQIACGGQHAAVLTSRGKEYQIVSCIFPCCGGVLITMHGNGILRLYTVLLFPSDFSHHASHY
jgi:hypothetical protein